MNSKLFPCLYIDIPLMDYEEALELQRAIADARKEKKLDEDIILFLEHPPVFTLGRNGGRENLIVSEDFLCQKGVKVVQIERGGNITYHGPGQLVVYPILNLNKAGLGIQDYVSGLEKAMADTAAHWGVNASGDPKNRGVWIGTQKLGSIGISISRGISIHGLALNVSTSLEPFTWINPCGFNNIQMTSIELQASGKVEMKDVRQIMKTNLEKFLGRKFKKLELSQIRRILEKSR